MNEIIILAGLILAAAMGYGSRAVIARLDEIPTDLEQVVIGFNRCDRCEFGGDHEAAAAHLGEALLAAAGQRGISRGQLLGFIAQASESVSPAVAPGPAMAGDLEWVEELVPQRRTASFGAWPREADALGAQVC